MHRVLRSERLLASIIIWPCWKALAHPYARVSMVTVPAEQDLAFWWFADVPGLCSLLPLIALHCGSMCPCKCVSCSQREIAVWNKRWDRHTYTRITSIIDPSGKRSAKHRVVRPLFNTVFVAQDKDKLHVGRVKHLQSFHYLCNRGLTAFNTRSARRLGTSCD